MTNEETLARNASVSAVGITTGIHSQDMRLMAKPKYIVNRLKRCIADNTRQSNECCLMTISIGNRS